MYSKCKQFLATGGVGSDKLVKLRIERVSTIRKYKNLYVWSESSSSSLSSWGFLKFECIKTIIGLGVH